MAQFYAKCILKISSSIYIQRITTYIHTYILISMRKLIIKSLFKKKATIIVCAICSLFIGAKPSTKLLVFFRSAHTFFITASQITSANNRNFLFACALLLMQHQNKNLVYLTQNCIQKKPSVGTYMIKTFTKNNWSSSGCRWYIIHQNIELLFNMI